MTINKIKGLLTALALLVATPVFAIEGLQVSIQSSNAVLSWPSNPSESYIVQYRPALDPSNSWQQLTNQYPADTSGSNITYFIHTNAVQYPSGGGSSTNTGGLTPPAPGSGSSGTNGGSTSIPGVGFYQVVREGVYITDQSILTNATLSGTVTLSFEAGNDTGILQEALMQADGTAFGGSTPTFTAPWNLSFDTAYFQNGTHTLRVEADWLNPDISDVNNFTFESWSDPLTINVTNLISYPNWDPEIGTNAAYYLETIYTNANWQLDIYDSSNLLVDTLTGQATNGIIEAYWNLTDTNGVLRTNADTDPYFNATVAVMPAAAPLAQAKTPPKTQRPGVFPNQGEWALAYQDTFQFMQNSNQYYRALYEMGSVAANFGGAYTIAPPASGITNTGQCWPLRYPTTNSGVAAVTTTMMNTDKDALRSLLTNVNIRNFFYNGHSGPDSFAYDFFSQEVASYVRHYFRFVFIDGCLSANGSLPAAFGIPYNRSLPLSYFVNAGIRPRTFLGYPIKVDYAVQGSFSDQYGTYTDQIPDSISYFLTNFEFYWYYNYDVSTAIYNAVNDTPYIGSEWATGQTLQVYGYDSLGVNDYNYGDAWGR